MTQQLRRAVSCLQPRRLGLDVAAGVAQLTPDDASGHAVAGRRLEMCIRDRNIDVAAAQARGIWVTNGRGANDECVADHAMGMVIAAMRDFLALDRLCRAGVWRTAIALPANVSGKRLGILGLGSVGERIASRAQAFKLSLIHI